MEDNKIDYATLESELERLENEAKTAVIVAKDGTSVGIVAEADTLKEDSIKAIAELEKMGLQTTILTGDNQRTGEAIARKVGISRVLAEVQAGDVVLVRGDLSGVVMAIKLSRATFRKIKTNLFWAFIYNIIMIPFAMLGLAHPVIAEIAMAISSITVVTNANLLRRAKIQPEYQVERR